MVGQEVVILSFTRNFFASIKFVAHKSTRVAKLQVILIQIYSFNLKIDSPTCRKELRIFTQNVFFFTRILYLK